MTRLAIGVNLLLTPSEQYSQMPEAAAFHTPLIQISIWWSPRESTTSIVDSAYSLVMNHSTEDNPAMEASKAR